MGAPCYYLIFVSLKGEKKKGKAKTTLTKKNLGKRERIQNRRPDVKKIAELFREQDAKKIKQKPRQNTIEKHKTNTDTKKSKVRPRKFTPNSDPKKRRTAIKRQGTQNRTQKHTHTKENTAFPPSKKGNLHEHESVRLPVANLPHPLPGLSFTVFGRKGIGGATTDLIGLAYRDSVARSQSQ